MSATRAATRGPNMERARPHRPNDWDATVVSRWNSFVNNDYWPKRLGYAVRVPTGRAAPSHPAILLR
eukprot:993554-Prymnesium_polylepis.1